MCVRPTTQQVTRGDATPGKGDKYIIRPNNHATPKLHNVKILKARNVNDYSFDSGDVRTRGTYTKKRLNVDHTRMRTKPSTVVP